MSNLVKKLEEVSGLQATVDSQNSLPAPVPMNYVSDLARVQQELDWKPLIGLEAGLKSLFGT